MKRWVQYGAVAALAALSLSAWADAQQRIRDRLEASRPDLEVASISASEVEGLYAVEFEQGPTVYATPDGEYFVLGDLFKVDAAGFTNLAERKREQARAERLAAVPREETIAFAPEGKTRAVISVFTDVDCTWCQRLHQDVPTLNDMGIEVRYLAYPRAGEGSEAYHKMVSAWCADDPRTALTRLKQRESITDRQCADNPVAEQFQLGSEIGVNGTPAMVTADGQLLPGYMPTAKLAALLGLEPAN